MHRTAPLPGERCGSHAISSSSDCMCSNLSNSASALPFAPFTPPLQWLSIRRRLRLRPHCFLQVVFTMLQQFLQDVSESVRSPPELNSSPGGGGCSRIWETPPNSGGPLPVPECGACLPRSLEMRAQCLGPGAGGGLFSKDHCPLWTSRLLECGIAPIFL